MKTVAIATCRRMPGLTASDEIFATALNACGIYVAPAPWNGLFEPFAAADAVIIRSTWDYFDVADEFAAWIGRLEALPHVFNSPEILRWNMTKAYLFELVEKGAPVPPQARTAPDAEAIAAAMDRLGLAEAIVKPLCGGTASGLSRVKRDDPQGLACAAAILNGEAMVQPFIPEIETEGETSFIFFGGVFSHAVLKRPKSGDIRVQEEHGGRTSAVSPQVSAIREAARILAMCPGETAYARIDAVVSDDKFALMEVELVEPELFFPYCPEAPDRFIEAVQKKFA